VTSTNLLLLPHFGHHLHLPNLGTEMADGGVAGQWEDEDGLDGASLLVLVQQGGGDGGHVVSHRHLHIHALQRNCSMTTQAFFLLIMF